MHQQKILLLENVATQAAGVREHLSQAGFQVAVSRYEADGLKRLVEWGPDVVLVSTAHPAGDFVEYCRRVRSLVPAIRIIVTSSLNRDRLFQEHPELQTMVDGVLLRPYSREEVAATLALAPAPAPAPPAPAVPVAPVAHAAAPMADPGNAELRAEFQRELDARFLEIEELKRYLEVATRRAASAPGLEWLQSENEHLRQGVEEARKKAALALATEQLKRSEIEVKLDNLLRMKEDFEFRAQNEIEARTQEIELARGQLQELRERFDKEAGEHAALRIEMERALIEKEQIEERLHTLEAGGSGAAAPAEAPPEDAPRLAALEAELSSQRALAAAGEVALADMAAKAAILEESLAREQGGREESERLLAQVQTLREQAAAEAGIAADLRERLTAAESAAAEARTANAAAGESRAALEKELAAAQQARAAAAGIAADLQDRLTAAESAAVEARTAIAAQTRELLERVASAERRCEQAHAARTGLEERLGASESARISLAAAAEALVEQHRAEVVELRARAEKLGREIQDLIACKAESESLVGTLTERERLLTAEVRSWREKADAAALEIGRLQAQATERAGQDQDERRSIAARQEQADRALAERDLHLATLREELVAAGEARSREVRDLEARVREAEAASGQAGSRLEIADAALVAAREGHEARERELRVQLEAQRAATREIEQKLAARAVPESESVQVQAELRRIQELLEEVISRARTEAVDYARRDAELSARLQAALEERRLLQERFDRASAEATERERRSSSLLQTAIDRGSVPGAERANLPAVVPLDPGGPGTPRRWPLLAGLAVATLAVLLAVFTTRRTTPNAVREQPPPVQRPQPGASPGVALTPRAVWDRWTRSDGSGGVLVQATLRSEEELRAEVEADRTSGLGEDGVRAELARRLGAFQFGTTYYVSVYVKNLAPGYPAYLDDLPGHFRLRDGSGREVPAFLPPGHEKDRRIFSFGTGAPGDLIYEASVSLGFDRAGLSPSAGYLQLIVTDVGAASRRVLTWELE